MSLKDKVVLVTGSSSGIGASIAIKLAAEGARVAIVGRNQEKLANVAKKCGSPLVLAADITKDQDAQRIISETVRHFGKLDILINNAGIAGGASIQATDALAIFDKMILTNLRAAVYLTHLAVPHLIKTKGNIVNVSSIVSQQVLLNENFAYSTSKAGLDHFTRCVALELAPSGVRVNVVNPGPVNTDILENTGIDKDLQEAYFQEMLSMTALKRVSEAEELADVILFLASEKAKGITGSSYVCDNGMLLKPSK